MGGSLTTRVVIAVVVTAMLAGCTSLGALFGGRDESQSARDDGLTDPELRAADDAEGLGFYLDHLNRLVNGDTLVQSAAFNQARDAAEFAPTTRNRLRYALALSVPGHSGSDAEAAATRLERLIASGDLLTREELVLAEMQLESANAIRALRETNRNAEQALANARLAQDSEHAADLASLEAENEALRTELETVQTMLDAITNIEQSLSEREDTDE
jgi:hypothetical protein